MHTIWKISPSIDLFFSHAGNQIQDFMCARPSILLLSYTPSPSVLNYMSAALFPTAFIVHLHLFSFSLSLYHCWPGFGIPL
jgi:hypothetical protein